MSRRWRGEQLAFMLVSPSILSRVGWKCAIKIVPPPISSHVDVWCSRNRLTEEEKRRRKRISRVSLLLLLRFSFDRRRIVAKNFTRETPLSRVHSKIFSPFLGERQCRRRRRRRRRLLSPRRCFPGKHIPAYERRPRGRRRPSWLFAGCARRRSRERRRRLASV